jgi:pyrophosphatase PpaX
MIAWVCDVNGVLVDTIAASRAAFAATAAESGVPFGESEYQAVKDLSLLEAYRLLGAGREPGARVRRHLTHVREQLANIRAYRHVEQTLAAARARGVRIAAATSHGATAEACLVHTGLYQYLDCLVTQEEVRRLKPHPDLILHALMLLGVDPQRRDGDVLYVGDSRLDIEAGRAAGVRTIGITGGVSTEAEIRNAGPDHVIHSFLEMRRFAVVPESVAVEHSQ